MGIYTLALYAIALVILFMFAAMIWMATTPPSPLCPRCGRRGGLETSVRRIPGTEHVGSSSERGRAFAYAKFQVHRKCPYCGFIWSVEETRQL
jgi:hypothetical protein